MKLSTFAATLSMTLLMGYSPVEASTKDVGVIGPGGEVILFYKSGEHIIVKTCAPNTFLGSTTADARAKCKSNSFSKVPLESFKGAIRELVSTENLNSLKPVSPEEVETYIDHGPVSENMEAMAKELENLNDFIRAYGEENADLSRRATLVKSLGNLETRKSAIKKINAEIENTINLIVNSGSLSITKANTDKDKFLYTVLKNFDRTQTYPCGLSGSVKERMNDCAGQVGSDKQGFVLVSRTKKYSEIFKEVETGRLWTSRLDNQMSHQSALAICKTNLEEFSNITEVSWDLPSYDEYLDASLNGIKDGVFPEWTMGYFFWTQVERDLFMGTSELAPYWNQRTDKNAVRCVGKPKKN